MQVGGGLLLLVRVIKVWGGGATSKLVLKTLHLETRVGVFWSVQPLNMNECVGARPP